MPIHRDVHRNNAEFFIRKFLPEAFVRRTRPLLPDGQHAVPDVFVHVRIYTK